MAVRSLTQEAARIREGGTCLYSVPRASVESAMAQPSCMGLLKDQDRDNLGLYTGSV